MKLYTLIGYDDTGRPRLTIHNYQTKAEAQEDIKYLLKTTQYGRIESFHIKMVDTKKPRRNPETVATAIVGSTSLTASAAPVVTNPYRRTTVDEYEIQGAYGQGWECVTTEETLKAAREQLRCYNENEPYPHRIVKRRVTKSNPSGGMMITGKDNINAYQMLALKGALKMEVLGMRHSSGGSAFNTIKKLTGLTAKTRSELLPKYEAFLRQQGILRQ